MKVTSVLSCLGIMGAAGLAHSTLYGLDSFSPGTVYTVNTATGVATPLVTMPSGTQTSITDIEFLGGVAYACDVFGSSGIFGSIDLTTGAYTPINNQGGSANWHGLGANESAGVLYAISSDFTGSPLHSITPAGVITTIGNTGLGGGGMTYDNNNGILYFSNGSNLWTINTTTAAPTLIGSLGVASNNASDLAYDGDTNTLYFNSHVNQLYTVNVSTGAATLVGGNGFTSPQLDGLGWAPTPVPEPATLFALASGAVLLLRRRKK
jgi:hypothetical protein